MMPRPASWYPLASADPVPGDPDAVRTAGHRHGGVAAGIATAANRLGTLLELPGAQTQAVDAVRAQWASLDAQLDRLRTGYDAVCAAMLRYAQALSIAQARSWSALVAARAAQSAIDTAEAELRRAQIALSTCPAEHVATCRLAVTRARSRVRDGDVALDRARHDLDDALVEYHAAVALARATVDDLTVGADARAIWDGTVMSDGHAKAGAASLAATLAGIEANRAVHGGQVHLVTLGHSYGSLVAGLAAAGETAMGDLVVFGSPGVGTNRVSSLTLPADRVFAGEARNDPVADLDWFGADPASPAFGAVPFQTDGGQHPLAGGLTAEVTGHSDYYAPGSESLWNITAVVIGEREAVTMGHTSGFGDRLRDSLFIADAEPPPSRFAQVP